MFDMKSFLNPSFSHPKLQNLKSVEALFDEIDSKITPMSQGIESICIKKLKAIYAIPAQERTYDNTILLTDRLIAQLCIVYEVLTITSFTHPSQKVRHQADKARQNLSNFNIEAFEMNQKLYTAFHEYADLNAKIENLIPQNTYFLNESMKTFKRNGLHLPKKEFKQLQQLKKEISILQDEFELNIREDNSGVWIKRSALAGVSASVIENLKSKSDLVFLGVDYPTYFEVMQNCTNQSVRKSFYKAFVNRAYPKNSEILDQLRKKRHLLATKLGFTSFTDYDLSDQMIQNSKNAYEMIHKIAPKLQAKLEKEKDLLKAQLKSVNENTTTEGFEPYDLGFLLNQYKKDKLSVDEKKISEYFPFNKVLSSLFLVYGKFFDLEFNKETIQQFGQETPFISVKQNGKLVGYIGLDLFPREGKYSHACCCMVIPPLLRKDSSLDPALAYIIANFTPPSKSKPSLLKHNEVKTLYHEFGHALHALFGKANNLTLAGYNTKIDFVELPSQILEEWLFDPEILSLVSSHFETKKPLDKELLNKKIAAKTYDSAHFYLRQIALTQVCLDYFSENTSTSTDKEYAKIMQHYLPHIHAFSDNNSVASFGHLSGYGAKYYSYLYSKILALDLFSFIKENGGLLNPIIGKRYLEKVISKGGSQNPQELIEDFLSRPPSDENFLKTIGAFS